MVTRAQADLLFLVLPVLGLLTGAIAAWRARRSGGDAPAAAILWGGPLILIGVLWRVYNAITDRIGLDRVANLGLNFVLFLVIGIICGVLGTNLAARQKGKTAAAIKEDTGGG